MATDDSKLFRSSADRVVAGVCGGLSQWLGWDPTVVRILYILISLFSAAFPGLIIYIILWVVMPEK